MDRLILVVDDEQPIVEILKFNLEKEGFRVLTANDGEAALHLARTSNPDLILLDIMLPKMDGFDVCKKVREQSNVPIVMITARDEEVDKVLGLELGADDYITKPFSVRELLARVKANMRRFIVDTKEEKEEILYINENFFINTTRYEVSKDGKVLELTLREYELLKFLVMQPNHIFSREALLSSVWGYEFYGDLRTVDVTVRRLREKIEDDSSNPTCILTKRGVGYYFKKAM
ncbi:MAG: response regulator transcription factor [Clostridia bacterium]|nr:response regulator transcription factor [Clostridia bacterium]MBQ3554283.1 response regulator transcription factor [Clostridia bacterium]